MESDEVKEYFKRKVIQKPSVNSKRFSELLYFQGDGWTKVRKEGYIPTNRIEKDSSSESSQDFTEDEDDVVGRCTAIYSFQGDGHSFLDS